MEKYYFELCDQPIDELNLKQQLLNETCGGFVSFEGWVRNHNDGQTVQSLSYQAYEALAVQTGQDIVDKALKNFDIEGAICVHRTGHLNIGDMAVWVGVVGAHRKACFEACQYIIDTVKAEVPIWKEEHYAKKDQQPKWLANEESLARTNDN